MKGIDGSSLGLGDEGNLVSGAKARLDGARERIGLGLVGPDGGHGQDELDGGVLDKRLAPFGVHPVDRDVPQRREELADAIGDLAVRRELAGASRERGQSLRGLDLLGVEVTVILQVRVSNGSP